MNLDVKLPASTIADRFDGKQSLKIIEEAFEAQDAGERLLSALESDKPFSASLIDDYVDELCDVIVSAMTAVEQIKVDDQYLQSRFQKTLEKNHGRGFYLDDSFELSDRMYRIDNSNLSWWISEERDEGWTRVSPKFMSRKDAEDWLQRAIGE